MTAQHHHQRLPAHRTTPTRPENQPPRHCEQPEAADRRHRNSRRAHPPDEATDPWMGATGRVLFASVTVFLAWASWFTYDSAGHHIDTTTAIFGGLTTVAIATILAEKLWRLPPDTGDSDS